ncbi:MAG TPA: alpha/beta fold hydrolase [Solirubrobacterales bacterium]|jgi:alpha-beta hydrolase superfamily lysophospholipase
MEREKVWFESRGARCAAWHYPAPSGACVVMAGGGGVTKEPGTDRFAARFQEAGLSVLAFDYRRLGESGGKPRQVIRVRDQLDDWDAAIATARALPRSDPGRIALWGFSLSGGHLFRVAARNRIAAVIAQTPTADGPAAMPNALRHETIGVIVRMPLLALLDVTRGLLGLRPLTIPLAGPRGAVAMLTTPDAGDGDRALNPGNRYPDWEQTIAARSVLPIGAYRPGRAARHIAAPLLVVVADEDRSALAAPAVAAARRAPRGELFRVPGGHYAPFLDQHESVLDAELHFLRRHLTGG